MTRYFCGPGGSNANNGQSWALRKLTAAGIEAVATSAGDSAIFGPGAYTATAALSASGGNAYTTGTVSVTNGSAVVTGSGSSWLANAFADGMFEISVIASGTDGVTNGTSTFTSAAGNFQSSMVGLTIRINGKAPAVIASVVSATNITLADAAGTAVTPSAGSGLTYNVGPESAYEILSVDTNTQLTLKQAWSGPTLTGAAYTTWRDIKWIGDESGILTDGIGGRVRFTGSDNNQTATRANCITMSSISYRTFRGFSFDTTTGAAITVSAGTGVVIEQCNFSHIAGALSVSGAATLFSMRKCAILHSTSSPIVLSHSSTADNVAYMLENLEILSMAPSSAITVTRLGGVTIRNAFIAGAPTAAIRVNTAAATGQATTVNNCNMINGSVGLQATATTDIIENRNNVFGNSTARSNVTVGANDTAYSPLMEMLLLTLGVHTWLFGSLSVDSALDSIAGLFPPTDDLYGTTRVATSSWGPVQYIAGQRPADAGESRGRRG